MATGETEKTAGEIQIAVHLAIHDHKKQHYRREKKKKEENPKENNKTKNPHQNSNEPARKQQLDHCNERFIRLTFPPQTLCSFTLCLRFLFQDHLQLSYLISVLEL